MAKIGIDIRLIGKNETGSEVYFFNLVKNLATVDRNNEYFLYTDRDPEKDADLKKETERLRLGDNFKIIVIDSPNRFWWNLWALPNHLRKNPVDIFHTQYIAPFWLPEKVRLVLTIHDISFNFFPEYIKKSDLFFLKTLIPRSIRRADKIITVSASEKENIADFYHIPPEKIEFTHNGADLERFGRDFSNEEMEVVRKKYNLPASANTSAGKPEKFLLYIGTLQPRKNIPAVIEALGYLDEKFVIAGNRNARNFDRRIDEAIKRYDLQDRVIFPGWIDEGDKPILYKLAAVFVFPPLYEGFGIPIVEAMAAGIPVVASDIPVHREIAEGAALFCDPKNSSEFAENISKFLTDANLRRDLAEKGKIAARSFTWRKTAEKTLGIYKKTLLDIL
jgi:glycosyltransferase involved in cell wall biosynthesis